MTNTLFIEIAKKLGATVLFDSIDLMIVQKHIPNEGWREYALPLNGDLFHYVYTENGLVTVDKINMILMEFSGPDFSAQKYTSWIAFERGLDLLDAKYCIRPDIEKLEAMDEFEDMNPPNAMA